MEQNGAFDTTPLYLKVRNAIVVRVQAGEWEPHESLPNEHALAVHYEVSVGTVRKALDLMEFERFLDRKQGRGTFVRVQPDWSSLPDEAKSLLLAIGGGAPSPDRCRLKAATGRYYTPSDLRQLSKGALELAAFLDRSAQQQVRAAA